MTGKEELEILQNVAKTENIYDFENYCGSCDNFPENQDENATNLICPFRNIVTKDTNWRSLGCKYFWD